LIGNEGAEVVPFGGLVAAIGTAEVGGVEGEDLEGLQFLGSVGRTMGTMALKKRW